MSDSWDFDESFTSKTQQINDESSDGEEKMEASCSQSIASNSDKEDHGNMSPVYHSRRRLRHHSPGSSPVFHSQSLLRSGGSRKSLKKSLDFEPENVEEMDSQAIQSTQTTGASPSLTHCKSGDSTKISSASSSAASSQVLNEDEFYSFHDMTAVTKKPKKPKKGGLVEKLDVSLKKLASDRVLSHHLPLKLRGQNSVKIGKAQVLKISSISSSAIVLTCLDYQLNAQTGKRQEFELILDNSLDIKGKKLTQNCDVSIEGPWQSFKSKSGKTVISNVFKFQVVNHHPKILKKIEKKIIYEQV